MIKLQNITKSFKKIKVLKNINLEIKKGECIVFSGVSGSGKSTLLSILGAVMKPSSGLVEVEGLNIVSLNDLHLSNYRGKTIGFVTQTFHLFEQLSVKENVMIPLIKQKISHEALSKKVNKVLQNVDILEKSHAKITTLSGGEKQRCMIARALVNNPKIILCDEPTANLDKENSLQFAKIMQSLKKEQKTIIIATHDPLILEMTWVDRVIKIEEGAFE